MLPARILPARTTDLAKGPWTSVELPLFRRTKKGGKEEIRC